MTFVEAVEKYDYTKRYRRRRNAMVTALPPKGDRCLGTQGSSFRLTTALGLVRILDDLDIRDCGHCEELRFALLAYLRNL